MCIAHSHTVANASDRPNFAAAKYTTAITAARPYQPDPRRTETPRTARAHSTREGRSSRSAHCGAVTAAKLLAEIGPIDRFQTDAQLARHGGVAPLEASSGRVRRHRLERGGNRQPNCALHRIAVT